MTPKDKKSVDETTKMNDSKTEWSEEEKRRLLDALKKYLLSWFTELLVKLYVSGFKLLIFIFMSWNKYSKIYSPWPVSHLAIC